MAEEYDTVCRTFKKYRTCNFTWVIDDIDDHIAQFKSIHLTSDPFTFIDTTWDMHLDYEERKQNMTLAVHLTAGNIGIFPSVNIVVNTLDENNKPIVLHSWCGQTSERTKIEFEVGRHSYQPTDSSHFGRSSVYLHPNSHYNPKKNMGAQNLIRTDRQLRLMCKITQCSATCFTNISEKYRQELCVKFHHDIEALLTNNKLKDCVLSVQGKDISAHQLILSARSPVLTVLLENCVQSDSKKKITIEGIKYETMLEVLNFMYTGKSDKIMTMPKVFLEAAIKFDMSDLKRTCQNILISTINAENVCDLFIFGDLVNASDLKNSAKRFICDNFENVRSTTSFQDMANHHPHLIIEYVKFFAPK